MNLHEAKCSLFSRSKQTSHIVIIKVHFSLQIIVIIRPQELNPRNISNFDNVFNSTSYFVAPHGKVFNYLLLILFSFSIKAHVIFVVSFV